MFALFSRARSHRVVLILSAIVPLILVSPYAQAMAEFALGGHNICAIDVDGKLECSTRFNARTYLPPDVDTLYTAVESGGAHTCAITQSGQIRCWGLNNFGQSNNIPTSSVAFTALSAGENHTCALDANGQVYCWGLNTNGQTDVPANNQDFIEIYAGALGSCGVRSTGFAECWSTDSSYTIPLIAATAWKDLVFPSEGSTAPACGLTNEGFIDCWNTSLSLPKPEGGPYINIESSGIFFCGLKADGDLNCSVFDFRGNSSTDETNLTVLAAIEALPPLVDFEIGSSGPSLNTLCGLDFNGDLHCVGNGLPADSLPGQQIDIPVPFDLSFSIYSDSAGELFWLSDTSSIRSPVSGYKVYRNGELVRFSAASASYFDDDLQPNTTYEYEVSIVLLDGTEGQKSATVLVSTGDTQSPPVNTNNVPDYLLQEISLVRYSGLSLELFWERPSGNNVIERYDVFRNGEYLASTPGPSYFDESIQYCNTYEYTVAAVSAQGDIVALGFQSEGTYPLTTCP